MIYELSEKNVGFDFKKNKSKLKRMPIEKLKKLYFYDKVSNNFGDISKISPDNISEIDYFTYSFPCTDLSVAGKQEGMIKGKTRSGLLYECEKIIESKKPKYLLMENVKNLVSKKFKKDFDNWCEYLTTLGYSNYWQVLNAKDYGIPQNRERVFMISILGKHEDYEFPEKQKLNIRLKDILEENIEEKYYLSDEIQNRFKITNTDKTANVIGTTKPNFRKIGQRDLVYNTEGIMGALVATDYKQPKQIIDKIVRLGGIFDTEKRILDTTHSDFKIRKLTPKECFRLMGLNDDEIDKIKSIGLSDSAMYKLSGNSIVKNVLDEIHYNLFKK